MLEDVTIVIGDISNLDEVVTCDELDAMYSEVHKTMYSTYPQWSRPISRQASDYDDYQVENCLRSFVRKLCLYLSSEGIPAITKAEIQIRGGLSPLAVKFFLSTGQNVVMRTLGIGYPDPFYQFDPCPSNQYIHTVYSSDKIGPAIRQELGYIECLRCYYSDVPALHCGLGVEMYTNKCMKKLYVHLMDNHHA